MMNQIIKNDGFSNAKTYTKHSKSSFNVLQMALSKDRKSTRLNSSHSQISYAVFCLKKKKKALESVPGLINISQTADTWQFHSATPVSVWPSRTAPSYALCTSSRSCVMTQCLLALH